MDSRDAQAKAAARRPVGRMSKPGAVSVPNDAPTNGAVAAAHQPVALEPGQTSPLKKAPPKVAASAEQFHNSANIEPLEPEALQEKAP